MAELGLAWLPELSLTMLRLAQRCWENGVHSVYSCGVCLCPGVSCWPGQAPDLLGLAEEQVGGPEWPQALGTAQSQFLRVCRGCGGRADLSPPLLMTEA